MGLLVGWGGGRFWVGCSVAETVQVCEPNRAILSRKRLFWSCMP